jgi:hypothetical protein
LIAAYGLLLLTIAASFLGLEAVSSTALWLVIFGSGISVGLGGLALSVNKAKALNETECLGPLLEAQEVSEGPVRELAIQSIREVLPKVKRGVPALTINQTELLSMLLVETHDADLASRIVGAFHRLEEPSAIGALDQIAAGKGAVREQEGERLQTLARMAVADIRISRAGVIISRSANSPVPEQTAIMLGDYERPSE